MIGGAPQLRHDLLLIVAILSDILDADSLEKVELAPDLALFEWLIEFKDSDQFDRTAKQALLLFGLDVEQSIRRQEYLSNNRCSSLSGADSPFIF